MIVKLLKSSAIAAVTTLFLLSGFSPANENAGSPKASERSIYVSRVFDGDTVEARIAGKIERIRLVGIDAPEMEQKPWGRRSKRMLEDMISSSMWQVGIEFDVEKRDKHDRVLAYLWARNGRMINEEMVKQGYAVLFTLPPNTRHVDRLRSAQVIARENGRGIWGKDGLKQLPSDYRKDHPRR